jgi:hypothetical protein
MTARVQVDAWRETHGGSDSAYAMRPAGEVNGGWGEQRLEAWATERCDIEHRPGHNFSLPHVMAWAARGAPVLLEGALADNAAVMAWPRELFLATHGDTAVAAGPLPDAGRFGVATEETTVAAYAAAHMAEPTALDASNGTLPAWPAPLLHVEVAPGSPLHEFADPRYHELAHRRKEDGAAPPRYSFGLGPAGAATPFALAYDTWHGLVYGERRWFLLPPGRAFYTRTPLVEWLAAEYPTLAPSQRPLEIVQRAGDVLWVPRLPLSPRAAPRPSLALHRRALGAPAAPLPSLFLPLPRVHDMVDRCRAHVWCWPTRYRLTGVAGRGVPTEALPWAGQAPASGA